MNNQVIDNIFLDLCAINDAEDKKCAELLKYGLKNEKVRNIAVTGPYGSGKTSFLKSFENNHKEYKYLNISLASFKEDESNKKIVEENILQQILYRVDEKKVPYSKIKRIKELSKRNYISFSTFLYLWLNSTYISLSITKLDKFKHLFITNYIELWTSAINIYFIISSLIFIYYFLTLFKTTNITIKTWNSEIQLSTDKEASIFYTHLDEIIYFFKSTKYNVIFFEDIDRFNNINLDLFTKLRELNNLLNESDTIKRTIHFIYAVKDDLFEAIENNSDKLRTKFFDLIVPIIPVINKSNSYEKIKIELEKIEDLIVNDEFDSNIRAYSYYIDDMRLINNIYNEFLVYKDNLVKANKIKDENKNEFCRILFAFIVYKNKYPNDFSELHFDRGMISDTFKYKKEIIENKISEIDEKIKEKELLIENAKNENLQNLKELRMIFIDQLCSKYPKAIKFEDEDISFAILLEDSFEKIKNSSNISYTFTNGSYNSTNNSGIKLSNLEQELEINYEERKTNINNKTNEKQEEIKLEIEKLKKDKNNIKHMTLANILNKYGIENNLPEKIINERLLVFLLENSLIEEKSFKNYISYFYGERLTREDFDFVESEIGIKIYKKNKIMYLEISDNGKGIKKENQKYIFQAGKTFGKHNGTGFGLVSAKKTIRAHEGTIDFISKEGEGTTFFVKIPINS